MSLTIVVRKEPHPVVFILSLRVKPFPMACILKSILEFTWEHQYAALSFHIRI